MVIMPLKNSARDTHATTTSAPVATASYRVNIGLPFSRWAKQKTGMPTAKMMVDNNTNFGPAVDFH